MRVAELSRGRRFVEPYRVESESLKKLEGFYLVLYGAYGINFLIGTGFELSVVELDVGDKPFRGAAEGVDDRVFRTLQSPAPDNQGLLDGRNGQFT